MDAGSVQLQQEDMDVKISLEWACSSCAKPLEKWKMLKVEAANVALKQHWHEDEKEQYIWLVDNRPHYVLLYSRQDKTLYIAHRTVVGKLYHGYYITYGGFMRFSTIMYQPSTAS